MQDIWPQLKQWVEQGEPFALATVVDASRPSPRGIGACLAVSADSERFIGSVSAGCVESAVIEAAMDCIASGETRYLRFGPDEGFPWEVSLSCGGKIEVRIERYPLFSDDKASLEATQAMQRALSGNRSGIFLSGDGRHLFFDEKGVASGKLDAWDDDFLAAVRENDGTRDIELEGKRYFVRKIAPRRRLVIVGASHIATHLTPIAKSLGYETVVVDPRDAYAKEERFATPPDQLIVDWPDRVFAPLNLGRQDAVVMLSHDPKIDDQALVRSLEADCGYVGALGSVKSHKARLGRLRRLGLSDAVLERIHGPVGLDIGSRTPGEIAVSIVAEMIQKRNRQLSSACSKPEISKRSS